MGLTIFDADVDGRLVDVDVDGTVVSAIRPARTPGRPLGDRLVVDAGGVELVPGLHDHHLHLLASAAAMDSLPCGPPAVSGPDGLAAALRGARPGGDGWVRGVGYHESVAGLPDAVALDAMVGDVPVRIQHRGGALWLLNGRGLAALDIDEARDGIPDGVERDEHGRPTGRLWRADGWLRERLARRGIVAVPDLAGLGSALAAGGVTGVTDATASNDARSLGVIGRAQLSGALPQSVRAMGPLGMAIPAGFPRLSLGECKVLLDDDRLPSAAELSSLIDAAHREDRGVALHCVTAAQLFLAISALVDAGVRGDRIEHASVAPPAAVALLARYRIPVVTQPSFVAERGERYLQDVDEADRAHLYPVASLLAAGVGVAGSSDAPYGSFDPWTAMRAAVARSTPSGEVLGAAERIDPVAARGLYLRPADHPAGPVRRVAVGEQADLVLVGRSAGALADPSGGAGSALTVVAGTVVHDRR